MEVLSLRAYKSIDSILSFFVPPEWLRVNSISNIINTTILLCYSDDCCSSLGEEFSSPISDITKALNYYFFACYSWFNTEFFCHWMIIQNLPCWIKNTQSCGLRSTSNTHLINMFASRNTWCVNISMTIKVLISIFN